MYQQSKNNHSLWYKDAVIYELHVKSFMDSNDDGIGDFKGLIQKLDYLKHLGVNAVWLLPFYPSPLKDDGYDIADYRSIHPQYGKLRDFKKFLKQAHQKGIRVITELVVNHTSSKHPWFQRSRKSPPGSVWRDYYVWSDSPEKYKDARIIFQDFESSNWTWDDEAGAYYWHRFYSHQPDLNFDNPWVQEEIIKLIDYWFEMGVDGLRLDAVPYLYEREGTNCENLPETHQFLKKIRTHVDRKFKHKMLLAEANQWPEDAAAYFGDGDEAHMSFHFPLMPRLFMAIQMENRFPIVDILDPPLDIPDSCQWTTFLRNHDELTLEMVTDEERDYMYRVYARDSQAKINLGIRRRLAPLLGNNRKKIELMNFLLFSLPGTPVIYYGDELGMGDNYYLGDRDGVRTPMQWSADRNAGFSKANPQKLYLPVIMDPEYHYEAMNVENQDKNLSSLLWWTRRVISMRQRFKAFGRGEIVFLSPKNNKILVFLRRYKEETILVVINLSRFSQAVELDLSDYNEHIPEEVFSHNLFPPIKEEPYVLTLGPFNYYWFLLRKAKERALEKLKKPLKRIRLSRNYREVMRGKNRDFLEYHLTDYLRQSRWFGGKGRIIRQLSIRESSPVHKKIDAAGYFLILEVKYNEGNPEWYFLPFFYAAREEALFIKQSWPQAVITEVDIGEENGIFYDGAFSSQFHILMMEMMTRRKKIKGEKGDFTACRGERLNKLLKEVKFPLKSEVLKAEQSNTSIVYDKNLILKLFRRLDQGPHPDIELEKFLTEKACFPYIPSYAGSFEYQEPGEPPVSVAMLQGYIPNQGDAWRYVLDRVDQYTERIFSQREELSKKSVTPFPLLEKKTENKNELEGLVSGFFLEMMGLLGKRTGELHLALSSPRGDTDFQPESFSTLYQRSVYQAMRSLVRWVFRLLEESRKELSGETAALAGEIIDRREDILQHMRRITGKKISAKKIRIHGDYHLGQVLFTGKDFVIIDFEGEPARALSERRLKRSVLRDVAGMIRSFHYAAFFGFLRNHSYEGEDQELLEKWLQIWYHQISRIFFHSYLRTVGKAEFLPQNQEELGLLLDAFLLEKAVYEVGYELNNRPQWTIIPLKGISTIMKQLDQSNKRKGSRS
ncbi:MAG: maltose alpha-D-glucosyltransferase [Acidobacteriota bacterium]